MSVGVAPAAVGTEAGYVGPWLAADEAGYVGPKLVARKEIVGDEPGGESEAGAAIPPPSARWTPALAIADVATVSLAETEVELDGRGETEVAFVPLTVPSNTDVWLLPLTVSLTTDVWLVSLTVPLPTEVSLRTRGRSTTYVLHSDRQRESALARPEQPRSPRPSKA